MLFLSASQSLTLLTRQGRVSQKAMTDEQAREVRLHKINIVHEFLGVLKVHVTSLVILLGVNWKVTCASTCRYFLLLVTLRPQKLLLHHGSHQQETKRCLLIFLRFQLLVFSVCYCHLKWFQKTSSVSRDNRWR